MRKPNVILLTGEEHPCEALRAALGRLKEANRSITCDVWFMPGASEGLCRSVAEHDGEAWRVTFDLLGIHVVGGGQEVCVSMGLLTEPAAYREAALKMLHLPTCKQCGRHVRYFIDEGDGNFCARACMDAYRRPA